jgi:hypothetical protein
MLQYFAAHVSGTALRLSRFAPIAQEEALMEFELTPASTLASWILLGIAGALLAATLLFAWFAWSASHLSVEVTRDALQLRVPLYGRTIPLSHLDLAHALVTDIDPASRVQPPRYAPTASAYPAIERSGSNWPTVRRSFSP